MTRYLRASILGYFFMASVACGQGSVPRRGTEPTPYQQRVTHESATVAATTDTIYRRRMLDLIRRSRLVPTDSLARLYALIPLTPDSTMHLLRQEIGCEGARLIAVHGQAAHLRAFERMADSLERTGFAYPRYADRMLSAKGPPLQFRKGSCGGLDFHRHVPDSLNDEVYPTQYRKPD